MAVVVHCRGLRITASKGEVVVFRHSLVRVDGFMLRRMGDALRCLTISMHIPVWHLVERQPTRRQRVLSPSSGQVGILD